MEGALTMKDIKILHLCLSIEGALKNRSFQGFTNDDGTPAHWKQVEKFLKEELAKGRRVLPMSKNCVGFDYQTGCPGHAKDEE